MKLSLKEFAMQGGKCSSVMWGSLIAVDEFVVVLIQLIVRVPLPKIKNQGVSFSVRARLVVQTVAAVRPRTHIYI